MSVIVGVDGAGSAAAAIQLAAEEAAYRRLPLVAVTAYPSRARGAPGARPSAILQTPEEGRAAAEAVLRETITDALGGQARGVLAHAVLGSPNSVLVNAARSLDARLIVLAARSGSGASRVLGTVSQYVLRHAPCPVLVVPVPLVR